MKSNSVFFVPLFIMLFLSVSCGEQQTNPNSSKNSTLPFVTATENNSRNIILDSDTPTSSTLRSLPIYIAEDKNPAPDIVEVEITAKVSTIETSPGVFSQAYTYNGKIPGPLIKTKVGDTLIVNFENKLPESTTIHWHGVRLPANMDGAAVAQNPIQPGAKFVYRFTVEDPALFWYHPHVRSNEQVEKGLAGTLLVEDPNESVELRDLKQNIIVLDDILLDGTGKIAPAFSGSPEQILLEKINGREGNVLLVNGVNAPTIDVEIDTPLRWRMVNIANSRFMRLSAPNTNFTRVGGDGGLLGSPDKNLREIFLVPGERADVVLTPTGKPGDVIPVYWNDTTRGRHTVTINNGMVTMGDDPTDGKQKAIPMMYLNLIASSSAIPTTGFSTPSTLRSIPIIDTSNAKTANFTFSHGMPMANGDISFLINGKTFNELLATDILNASIGDTYIFDLVNTVGGDHPFHLHGFFFQVLETISKDETGKIIKTISNKKIEDRDMVNLPRRPGAEGSSTTVRIAVDFSPGIGRSDNDIVAFGGVDAIVNADILNGVQGHSGGWQFHCHILEHADTGMMSFLNLQ